MIWAKFWTGGQTGAARPRSAGRAGRVRSRTPIPARQERLTDKPGDLKPVLQMQHAQLRHVVRTDHALDDISSSFRRHGRHRFDDRVYSHASV